MEPEGDSESNSLTVNELPSLGFGFGERGMYCLGEWS